MMRSATHRVPVTGVRSILSEIAPTLSLAPRGRIWLVRLLGLLSAAVFVLLIMAHGGQFVRAIERPLKAGWHLVALAAALEAGSVAGYVFLLHRVVARASPRLSLKDSYDMTLGGAAATRLLPTAGLGGAAVTVWALRARGVRASEITERLLAFLLLLYGVFISALLASGAALAFGLVSARHGRVLGMLGATIACAVVATVAILFGAPSVAAGALGRVGVRRRRLASAGRWGVEQLPILRASLGRSWRELRRPHPELLGGTAYWGLDIGVLIIMLHAFGVEQPLAPVVLAYFLGATFNLVPLPGSLSSGLTGCLIAMGSPAAATIAAVLAYRALAVWTPAVPGIVSLARLRTSVGAWRIDAVDNPAALSPSLPVSDTMVAR